MRKLLSTIVLAAIAIIAMAQGSSNEQQGELSGIFSVGENKYVKFSQGNLQYQPSTHIWRFAEQQWETIGVANDKYLMSIQNTPTEKYMEHTTKMVPTSLCPEHIDVNLWLDIFWFGSSGENDFFPEIKCDQIKMIKPDKDLNYDWGRYCSISNGGNQVGLWRTLSAEEWNYLFFERTNAQELFGFMTIGTTTGLVLLPDNYKELINDTSLYPSRSKDIRKKGKNYYFNKKKNNFDNAKIVSQEQWIKMQNAGAVFLPNVSIWIEKEITIELSTVGTYSMNGNPSPNSTRRKIKTLMTEGFYWAWTRKGMAYNCLNFNNEFIYTQDIKENIYRLPVRLVKDVK